ncbi:hypothetical protein LINPERHAP2_LOCUS12614, partial [Linum perenne]
MRWITCLERCRLGYEVVVSRTHRFYGVILTDIERREFSKL